MAITRLPSYTVERKGAFYWQVPTWARPPAERNGVRCHLESKALGRNKGAAITEAERLNEALREWRSGPTGSGPTKGTIAWLFGWYRGTEWYTDLSHKTRGDYAKIMSMLASFETKKGSPRLGLQMAARVDAVVADKLYRKLRERGDRQAAYAMQVCKLVWNKARRPGYSKITGVTENPFLGMGVKGGTKAGNRATSRAEYNAYRAAARKLGYQSMATAAALAFEGCQRTWDVFGFEDPDGRKARGFAWADYRPGVTIGLRQSKTGNAVVLPLAIDVEGDVVDLYPELEDELARSLIGRPDGAEFIVTEERNGAPYKERRMSSVHRAICEAAGLPKAMTFTGFRHGGITEIGNSGEADPRAVSGHKTLAVTGIYNKANEEKARRIAAKRREHIALVTAGDDAA